MATTDRLTGATNRHVFEMMFEQTVKASKRRGDAVCVISLDIDRFKAVNDEFGHPGGDAAIKALADLIRAQMRDSDTVCRWGGEEFLILMPNCTADKAVCRAETLRDAVRQQPIPFGREQIQLTVSMGVAQYRYGEGLETLLARVDAALYNSKHEGRDRVTLATASTHERSRPSTGQNAAAVSTVAPPRARRGVNRRQFSGSSPRKTV